jgi:tripartite-type tricarboxylate transporter receptor subunit TctC
MLDRTHVVSNFVLVASAIAALGCTHARAQDYPARPIRLIVPVSPGATTDTLARAVAAKLGESLGQQVVVDNRAGASAIIGTDLAAKAAPDGYTLLVITSTHTINPSLQKSLPYDPVRDFSPVTLMASSPTVLVVHPSVPARSVRELIALARARPGQLNYGSGGTGSSTHLVAELFKSTAGIEINHVPYKGAGPALIDVLAGQLHFMFSGIVPALPHVKAGKLRALGITGLARSSAAPEIPTLAESGLPGFSFGLWYGVLGPAGLPERVVGRLRDEIRKVMALPDVRARLAAEGAEVVASSPQELLAHMQKEIATYRRIVQAAGIKADDK